MGATLPRSRLGRPDPCPTSSNQAGAPLLATQQGHNWEPYPKFLGRVNGSTLLEGSTNGATKFVQPEELVYRQAHEVYFRLAVTRHELVTDRG